MKVRIDLIHFRPHLHCILYLQLMIFIALVTVALAAENPYYSKPAYPAYTKSYDYVRIFLLFNQIQYMNFKFIPIATYAL